MAERTDRQVGVETADGDVYVIPASGTQTYDPSWAFLTRCASAGPDYRATIHFTMTNDALRRTVTFKWPGRSGLRGV